MRSTGKDATIQMALGDVLKYPCRCPPGDLHMLCGQLLVCVLLCLRNKVSSLETLRQGERHIKLGHHHPNVTPLQKEAGGCLKQKRRIKERH